MTRAPFSLEFPVRYPHATTSSTRALAMACSVVAMALPWVHAGYPLEVLALASDCTIHKLPQKYGAQIEHPHAAPTSARFAARNDLRTASVLVTERYDRGKIHVVLTGEHPQFGPVGG